MRGRTPQWARVLHALYETERGCVPELPTGNQTDHELTAEEEHVLVTATDLDREEIRETLRYLQDADLVERNTDTASGDEIICLKRAGFEVIHRREQRELDRQRADDQAKTQRRINQAIGILTLGFVVVTFVGASMNTATALAWPTWVVLGLFGVGVVTIGVMAWQARRTGLFSDEA